MREERQWPPSQEEMQALVGKVKASLANMIPTSYGYMDPRRSLEMIEFILTQECNVVLRDLLLALWPSR